MEIRRPKIRNPKQSRIPNSEEELLNAFVGEAPAFRGSIGAIVVVCVRDSAVVKAAIGAGGAYQDAGIRKINAQGRAPGINKLTSIVHVIFLADNDDDVLGVVPLQRHGHFEIATYWKGSGLFLVLLESSEEVVHLSVKLRGISRGPRVDHPVRPGVVGPYGKDQNGYQANTCENLFHGALLAVQIPKNGRLWAIYGLKGWFCSKGAFWAVLRDSWRRAE